MFIRQALVVQTTGVTYNSVTMSPIGTIYQWGTMNSLFGRNFVFFLALDIMLNLHSKKCLFIEQTTRFFFYIKACNICIVFFVDKARNSIY